MLGFGCKVLAYDPFQDEELIKTGIRYERFEMVVRSADIISLHCPLSTENHHIIDTKSLSLMKDKVTIINTSRGALLNTADVIQALKNGKIAYLGIDVYEQEEKLFFKDLSGSIIEDDDIQRLMSFPNVLLTGHQAFFTEEALGQIASITLNSINEISNGIPFRDPLVSLV
jgi:D-lactate dehydrogenase